MKKSLKRTAQNNARVTKGTSVEQEVIKEGVPNDYPRKRKDNVVGMSLGITKNMDNYESLRVDCWLQDEVAPNETKKDAFERITNILDEVLNETVEMFVE